MSASRPGHFRATTVIDCASWAVSFSRQRDGDEHELVVGVRLRHRRRTDHVSARKLPPLKTALEVSRFVQRAILRLARQTGERARIDDRLKCGESRVEPLVRHQAQRIVETLAGGSGCRGRDSGGLRIMRKIRAAGREREAREARENSN